ncbi:MAG: hypothetical protein ABL903_03890 [Methylococcales bacterium]
MKFNTILVSSIVTVALLAGCDKGGEPKTTAANAPTAAPAAEGAKDGFGPALDSAATAGSQAIEETKSVATEAATAVQENVTQAADQAAGTAQEAGQAVAEGAEKAAEATTQAVEGAQNAVDAAAESVKNAAAVAEQNTAKAVEEIKK